MDSDNSPASGHGTSWQRAATPPAWVLEPLGSNPKARTIRLGRMLTVIASASSSGQERASKRSPQLAFVNDMGRVFVRALNQRAALQINGQPCDGGTLWPGDQVRIGLLDYRASGERSAVAREDEEATAAELSVVGTSAHYRLGAERLRLSLAGQ